MPRHEKSQKSPKKFLNFYRFAFGPQHPASHGVLTCLLYLSNEYIIFSDCVIGYLHRGTEKLCEFRKPNQNIPYFDRLDYVSIIFCEHSYVLSFESLFNGNIQLNQSMLRVVLFELTRIFNGLLCISCMLFDIGCMSPLL
jgi:NADH-quinone oxidoreductase subunit D